MRSLIPFLFRKPQSASLPRAEVELPDEPALRPQLADLLQLRAAARMLRLPRGHATTSSSGGRPARLRGRGMDYRESRAYQPGDEIRHMDWRVLARRGVAHTKLFETERDRPALLVMDLSPSMFFGTRKQLKSVQAAHSAMLVGWALLHAGDRVGALMLREDGHRELRPAPGLQAGLALARSLRDWTACRASSPARDSQTWQRLLQRSSRPGSLLVMFTDLHGWEDAHQRCVAALAAHRDLVLVVIEDPIELNPPERIRLPVSTATDAVSTIDATDPAAARTWRLAFVEPRERLIGRLQRDGLRCIRLSTDQDPLTVMRMALAGPSGELSR